MTRVGIGLPGLSVADVRHSAETAANYAFDSFSVYGDLGDLPPYAVLHAGADLLKGTHMAHVGPMGIPVGLQHSEVIAVHAAALEEQLPGQSSLGLVRGAFLSDIEERPASLQRLKETVQTVRRVNTERDINVPIYVGGFGPKLLGLAGELAVKGVKLGGSTNPVLAERAAQTVANADVDIVLGAVSVIDPDRKAARECARKEVAKYLRVVGHLDTTLDGDERDSLLAFTARFEDKDPEAAHAISDALLDKFAIAGTPDDALGLLARMQDSVARFEFGTPHGLADRATAIKYIGETIVKEHEG